MGLRDKVAGQIGSRNTGRGAFMDEPGLYEVEVSFAGEYDSALEDGPRYWKIEGVIVEVDKEAPSSFRGDDYSPLEVGQEVVVIHNFSKDRYGYARDERRDLKSVLGIESWEDAAGCIAIVEVWEKSLKKGSINVRSWMASPRNRNAVSGVETSDNAKTQDDGDDGFEVMPF